jgi:hypothetical protein
MFYLTIWRLITFWLQEMGRQMMTELDSHLAIFNKTLLELEFQAAQKDSTHFVLFAAKYNVCVMVKTLMVYGVVPVLADPA